MTKRWLSTALVGVLGLLLHPGISSSQVRSPAVTGISAGTNYYPYRGYGGSYYFARPYFYARPMYYDSPAYYAVPAVAMPNLGNRALLDVAQVVNEWNRHARPFNPRDAVRRRS